jgi:hypothetical protein
MRIHRRHRRGLLLFVLLLAVSVRVEGAPCTIPAEAGLADTTSADQVVGSGTPQSCTSAAFVAAVAQGGIITFDCGPEPVTIVLTETAKVFNNTGPDIVIDGGNLVTLSGGGERRILYMNTCDPAQVWTTSHCQNQDHPRLTVQNLTFADGNSEDEGEYDGGGAIWVRGGRFKIVHCRFVRNVCALTGPDVGGAAVRVFSQYNTLPVYVVDSVFGGAPGDGNIGSNGGGLSSIGVSYTVINSLFSHNEAVGYGGNPAQSGTPGGGSGAAIYNDGNTFHLSICGTAIHDNIAHQYGGSIFFVSNNNTGTMRIENSGLWNNETPGWLTHDGGISYQSFGHDPLFINSYRSNDVEIEKNVTIDVDADERIGLAEVLYALAAVTSGSSPQLSLYARKLGDIDYNHRLDLADVIHGLKILSGDPSQ